MIVVRVELHSAITGLVTEIARFDIWNVGGTKAMGNYKCASMRGRTKDMLSKRVKWRESEVNNHPRLREHVLNLVAKALLAMGYSK